VGFVEDDDFEAVADGGEAEAVAQFPGVIDTAVTGGVDFEDVERPGRVAG
jgi:hemerythrin superfamily protein